MEKTIKITHRQLMSPLFANTLQTLANEKMTVKTAHNLGVIINKLETTRKQMRETWDDLISKHFKKDDKGQVMPVKDENGHPIPGQFHLLNETDEGKETWKKQENEFLDIEITINRFPLTLDSLKRNDGSTLDLPAATFVELAPLFDTDEETVQ